MESSEIRITREQSRDGPSSSLKSTTYETRSSSSYEVGSASTYKPTLGPRHLVINRTASSGPANRNSYTLERSVHYGHQMGVPAGAYAVVTSTGVNAVKSSREKEKKDMQDLNERFASYIEKVRFLEAQNRRLADELEKLKARWGKETTQIKAMYQAELDEARRLLDEAEKDKARLEIKVASMEEQMEEMRQRLNDATAAVIGSREKIEHQNQQLSDYEAEINLLRRRLDGLETDRDKDRKLIAQLQDSLNRARIDLDNETLLHIDAENRRQTLEEELEFLKQVHEQEMKELAALAYRDTTAENREFWKNEMGQALREIQQVYDEKLDSMRGDMETFYNLKVQEFRTGATRQNMESVHTKEENKRLRSQLTDLRDKLSDLEARNLQLQRELESLRREREERERELEDENRELKSEVVKLRAEMESILKELQEILDTKLGLELEIAAYRKLLEGEENRVGLRQIVEQIISNQDQRTHEGFRYGETSSSFDGGLRMSQVVKGEMSAKTTYQRSAKGPVSIAECGSDGKYIALENTGRKDEQLGGWKLKRNIDGLDKAEFAFDNNCTIKSGGKLKVWANGQKPDTASPLDVEATCFTWGMGGNITTKLINQTGEDRATHIQKTVYTS